MGHRKSDQAAINKQSNPAATNKQSDPTTTYKRSDLTATGNQAERQWNSLYRLGAIAALFMIAGTLSDLFIGTMSGGDITTIPLTAADRFLQFQSNSLMGLYNLDLLNALTGLIMVPVFIALVAAHRRVNLPYALLSLVVFIIGTSIFVGNNTALPMLELSQKYAAATTDARRIMLESAGEAMLVRGAHGSPGVFLGFALNSCGRNHPVACHAGRESIRKANCAVGHRGRHAAAGLHRSGHFCSRHQRGRDDDCRPWRFAGAGLDDPVHHTSVSPEQFAKDRNAG